VVADEVRSLASRTQVGTLEINCNVFTIEDIVNELMSSSQSTSGVSQKLTQEGAPLGRRVGQFKV